MRMSPPPPGVFQYTSDSGHPDQVPWTLRRLYDPYSSHHRQISPPLGVFQYTSKQVILIGECGVPSASGEQEEVALSLYEEAAEDKRWRGFMAAGGS